MFDPYFNKLCAVAHLDDLPNPINKIGGTPLTLTGGVSALDLGAFRCAEFDGTGLITMTGARGFPLGGSPFTIEFQVTLTAFDATLLDCGFIVRADASGAAEVYAGETLLFTRADFFVLGQAMHVTLVRSADNYVTLLRQGGNSGNTRTASTLSLDGAELHLGARADGSDAMHGYLSELRVTKAARYAYQDTLAPAVRWQDNAYYLSGSVLGPDGVPVDLEVAAYRRSDRRLTDMGRAGTFGGGNGNIITEAGKFKLSTLDDSPHYAVCLPTDATRNALILDRITPRNDVLGAVPAEILLDGPALWWRMNETEGNVLVDSSGHGASGMINGTIGVDYLLGQEGLVNDEDVAVSLETESAWVVQTNNVISLPNPKNFTFMAAFRLVPGLPPSPLIWVGEQTDSGPWDSPRVYLKVDADGSLILGARRDGSFEEINTLVNVGDGARHLAHVTCDGSLVKLYLSAVMTVETSAPINSLSQLGLNLGDKGGRLAVSGNIQPPGFNSPMAPRGVFDEVAVFNQALSPERILAHAQAGGFQ
jgi:hypothetical protein